MAQYDGAVIIQTDINTDPYDKGLRQMEQSAKSFSGNLSSIFKGIGATLAGAFTFKEFANLSGVMVDLESRARIASKGLEDTGMIMNRLREIADRAYSPFEATATAFMNNATALNALGMSMEQQLNMTDALTNALVISGAKGEQFELVMNAINRSLAIGIMKSQELQIVQKYGGVVAESLATSLGTTVLGLKDFAKDGKITADVIQNALTGNLEKFRQTADEMPATIGDALTRLRNQILFTASDLDKAFDITPTTVKSIDTVRDNLKNLQPELETALQLGTAFFVTLLGSQAINAVANFVRARVALASAIAAEIQAEKASIAVKNQATTANTKLGSVALTQARERQTAAQITLQAVKQEALANLEEMQSARAAQAAKVQKIQTTMVEVEALHRSAAAKTHSAAQSAILAKMDRELAVLSGQLAVAKTGLAAATGKVAVAQTALTTASSKTVVAMSALRAAGAGVLAMFGGPWGLALTAAAGGIYYLATRQSEGEKVSARYATEIEKLREQYGWLISVADGASESISKISKTQLSLQLRVDTKSLVNLEKDVNNTLGRIAEMFTRRLGSRGGVGAYIGPLFGDQELQQEFLKIQKAYESGRRDLAPEIDAFEDLLVTRFGKDIPELVARGVEKLKEDILGIEAVTSALDSAGSAFNDSLSEVGDVDWSPILNKQKSFSEQLLSQLRATGVDIRGVKFFDLTAEVAGMEKSQEQFRKLISEMTLAIDMELKQIRTLMSSATIVPEEVSLRESELVAQRIQLTEGMYAALQAKQAEYLTAQRLAIEADLNNKKLAANKEVEIRTKAAEEVARAMASQGSLTREALEAIIDTATESEMTAAAQRSLAQATLAAAKAAAVAQAGIASMAMAAAAAIGDFQALTAAAFELAAASAAIAGIQAAAEDIVKDFTPKVSRGGGGGGRGKKGGGLNEQKKALQEIELILAKMSGDFEKVREIEANQELEKFIELTKKAGLSSAEAAAKIEEFKEKQASHIKTENLQTLISFYDELRGILPLAAAEFDELNAQLIEQKAQALLAAGANRELVETWKELQALMSSTEWEAGIKRSAQEFINEWTNAANIAEKAMSTMITGMQDLASGVIDSLFDGAEFRADTFLKNLGKKMLMIAANAAIAQLMKFFGFGVGTAHTGGIVGTDVIAAGKASKMVSPFAFIGAQKYHTGGIVGLSSAEVPAILQRGEGVFTAAQMKALAPSDSMSFKQDIKIVNPPGMQLSASVQNQQGSNGVLQTDIILKSIEDGLSGRMKSGQSKLTPTIEGRYGLNSARGRYLRTGG